MTEMVTVTIDNQQIEVPAGTTILDAARQLDAKAAPPAMCYYPTLKDSGGKCRTCLVKIAQSSEKNPRPVPRLAPACRTTVEHGMVVQNQSSKEVLDARKGVVELLLINHPLDCPICDQAGECDLQNLAFEHGKEETRYEEPRRQYPMKDIGPLIKLHMNRCILCFRCVYVADQITDKRVHGVLNRGDASEIGTYIQNAVDNDFSGNMIDVCPVGALTDKTFRFKSRVWFARPIDAHRNCDKCCGKAVLWMKGDEVLRVTARKNAFAEVLEFICNTCRFDSKEVAAWTIEGPTKISDQSVISQNHYEQTVNPTPNIDHPLSAAGVVES